MTDKTVDYHPMWNDLGLDLEKHDALLNAVGQGYQEVFLKQENRPETMSYFDFVMSEVHGLRIKELVDAREEGRIVVGSFCVFVPEELILAVNGISVGLCAGAEFAVETAEQFVPRNTCSLIKSAFSFAAEKVCPYIAASDIIVGENTCDGKKKSYESFAPLVNSFHVMDLPQMKSEEGRSLLKAEFMRFAQLLEQKSGKAITVESLKNAIETVNAKRRAMHKLSDLRKASPSVISGLDALLINQIFFYDNPERFTESVEKVNEELQNRIEKNNGVFSDETARIVVSGCPMAVPNWKLHSIVENCGAVVVGDESCVGDRGTQNLTSLDGDNLEVLIDNIVDRYFQIDCAVFTPNQTRIEHVKEIYKKTDADGVLHYGLQYCSPYQMESIPLEDNLENAGMPTLRIETDYSQEDVEQIRTRIEAFIERIKG